MTALINWELGNERSVILCQMIRHCDFSIYRLISSPYQRHCVFHCRRAYGLQALTTSLPYMQLLCLRLTRATALWFVDIIVFLYSEIYCETRALTQLTRSLALN
jgi:hypothetical protein